MRHGPGGRAMITFARVWLPTFSVFFLIGLILFGLI